MKNYFLWISFSVLLLSSSLHVVAFADSTSDNKIIQWSDRCARVDSVSVIRVIDDEQNKNPKEKEWFDIEVWSDSDKRGISRTLTETDTDTGVFESTVFFYRYEEKSNHRVLAFSGDIIYAKYVDKIKNDNAEMDELIMIAELPILEWTYDTNPSTIMYEPCTVSLVEKILQDPAIQREIFYPAPLKQIESGLYLDEIQCKESLTQVIKHNGLPVCVKEQSIPKLVERKWIVESQ